jgi:hypothetical protein
VCTSNFTISHMYKSLHSTQAKVVFSAAVDNNYPVKAIALFFQQLRFNAW